MKRTFPSIFAAPCPLRMVHALAVFDASGSIIAVNNDWRLLPEMHSELHIATDVGARWQQLISDKDAAQGPCEVLAKVLRRFFEGHRTGTHEEVEALAADGQVFYWTFNVRPAYGVDGQVYLLTLSQHMRDRERLHLMRTIINASSDATVLVDADTACIVDVNDTATGLFDAPREALCGQSFAAIDRRFEQTGTWASYVDSVTAGEIGAEFASHYTSRGLGVPVEVTAEAISFESERYMVLTVRDLTDRMATVEALRTSERRYRDVLEGAADFLFVFDHDHRIHEVNRAACEALGYHHVELCDLPLEVVVACGEGHGKVGAAVAPDGDRAFRAILKRKDGSTFPAEMRISVVAREGRTLLLAFARDISDRERLELELLQARKLESIGQLAAGIAHEINTPTQFISDNLHFLAAGFERLLEVLKSYSELVERYCLSGADRATVDEINRRSRLDYLKKQVPKALEQSLDGVNRVTTIVGAMRNFSHHGEEKKVSFDLNASIHNTIVVATNEWKYVANIVFELDAALPFVPGVPGEINQVLLNLVVNAAHAIGDKVDQSRGETGTITLRSGVADGCAFVAISDTGSGIPTTVRDRIFDPFFTTKKLGRGTGQGLAICRNVVQDKHGGRLTFETEEGVGTTFFVRLPLAKDEAPTSPH